jgi:phage terminase small subunit
MSEKLTPKQALFCKEYLVDRNGTQAAIRAGYAEDSASVEGSRLLTNAKVAERIQKGMDARAIAVGIDAEMVLAELCKLGTYNVQDFIVEGTDGLRTISDLDRDHAAAITEITTRSIAGKDGDDIVIETKVKLADKGQNLERIGKHLKLFTDRTELSGHNGGPIDWNLQPVKSVGDSTDS